MKMLFSLESSFYKKVIKAEETMDSNSSIATSYLTNHSIDAFGDRVASPSLLTNRNNYMKNKKLFNTQM
jgi:hypothetical protein